MSRQPPQTSSQSSSTWLRKGMETLTRMNRIAPSSQSSGGGNPLRELFSDLMAFVIFFESTCEQQPPSLQDLRDRLLGFIKTQEERVKTIGVSIEAFREARFSVLSWVDEMVLNSKWPHRTQWQHLMLTYYGTLNAGEEFFRRLDSLPSQANDIREIFYLCLSLGFQGEYAFANGARELQALRQRLYKQLCAGSGDIRENYSRLFPEAYQRANVATQTASKSYRIWHITAVAVPILLFAVYWVLLNRQANRIIALLNKPLIVSEQSDWSTDLVTELRKKGLRAVDEPEGVRITLESLLFASGSANLNPTALDKINDIITTVKHYAPERVIVVEGHASKEAEGQEAKNRQLSEDRAQTVVESFVRAGFRRDKTSGQGFGASRPVALNDTEANRSLNRRVEIIVKK
jgi:type VI secretion system protein ImpK